MPRPEGSKNKPKSAKDLLDKVVAEYAKQGKKLTVNLEDIADLPDDVKAFATATLAHRLIVSPSARLRDVSGESVMREILSSLPVPGAHVRPT